MEPVNETISEKKRAIFESTLQLVREHGFHGTPMSMVAKRAGVAAGTIYHYFEGKDELIRELYIYNRHRLVEVVNTAVDAGGGCRTIFYRICESLYGFYVNHPDVLVFFEQFLNSPYCESVTDTTFESRPLEDFLNKAVELGKFKNYPVRIFLSTLLSAVVSAAKISLSDKSENGDVEFEQITDILWDGFVNHTPIPSSTSKT